MILKINKRLVVCLEYESNTLYSPLKNKQTKQQQKTTEKERGIICCMASSAKHAPLENNTTQLTRACPAYRLCVAALCSQTPPQVEDIQESTERNKAALC